MRKAFFVAYGGGHIAMVIPTIREMHRRGGWEIVALGLTTAGAKLREAEMPALGFQDLLDPNDQRAKQHGERLARENHNAATTVPWEESVAYLGLSYADLEDRVGIEEAAMQYAAKKRHAFLPIGPLKRVLMRERPDVVVVTSSPRAERAAVLAARELGIHSVVMMDLFGKEWDYFYDPEYGDQVQVFAPMVYEDYLRRGRTKENLVMTGNPSFDRLAEPQYAAAGLQWRADNGLIGKQVILWAATTLLSVEHRGEVLAALAKCARQYPHWRVVFRPHPNAGPAIGSLPKEILLADNRLDLAIHLHAADCVLVTISTCGVEAALLDKPVVKMRFVDPAYRIYSPDYARMDAMAPYEEMGIAVPVTRVEDLDVAISSSLTGGAYSASLKMARSQLPPIGRAAENAVNAIENLLNHTTASSIKRSAAA